MATLRDPREYELMTILLPDMSDEDSAAAIDKVSGYISDGQGEITQVLTDSPWGRRRLAYTIRHEGTDYRDGHYVLTYFSAVPAAIADMERELKLDTNVIRYLLVNHDPKAGDKSQDVPPTEGAEPTATEDENATATTESAPAEEGEAPAVQEAQPDETIEAPATDIASDTAPAVEGEAPAVQEAQAEDAAEEAVAEAAPEVEAEDEPAPADAPVEETEEA